MPESLYLNGELLCEKVDIADTFLKKAVGRMFSINMPEELGLVFKFDEVKPVSIHMAFVFYPLGVLWIKDREVVEKRTLPPWIGWNKEEADMVIEIHPDKLSEVEVGDKIEIK